MSKKINLGISYADGEVKVERPERPLRITDHKQGHVCRKAGSILDRKSRKPAPHTELEPTETPALEDDDACRDRLIVLPGHGKEEYPFPTADELTRKISKKLAEQAARATQVRGRTSGKVDGMLTVADDDPSSQSDDGNQAEGDATPAPASDQATPVVRDQAILVAAEGLRITFENGQYDALVAERFDDPEELIEWAEANMAAKYQPVVASLKGLFTQMSTLYKEAIPKVVAVIEAQYPGHSPEEYLAAALQQLDEELVQPLSILGMYNRSFHQHRRDKYARALKAITFFVEQCYHLVRTGDVSAACDEDCQERIKSTQMTVEDVFLAVFSGMGPATIPGTAGPVGAHLMSIPHDEQDIICTMGTLYGHEFWHDLAHAIQGYLDEMTLVLATALRTEFDAGNLELSKKSVNLGRQKVSMIKIITKLFVDTLGELDADYGALQMVGPSFATNMDMTFPAFNSKRARSVFRMKRHLRAGSIFAIDEQGGLQFEVHLPDYIRAIFVAAMLDAMGFSDEAREYRDKADQLGGDPLPKNITWVDASRQRKWKIKLPVADLEKAAPVLARAWLSTPLQSLGGVPMSQVVNWTPRRQAKTDLLRAQIVAGSSELPDGYGDYVSTYAMAAFTLAYLDLCKQGVPPLTALAQVEKHGLAMLETIKERAEHPEPTVPQVTAQPAVEEPVADGEPQTEGDASATDDGAGDESTGE